MILTFKTLHSKTSTSVAIESGSFGLSSFKLIRGHLARAPIGHQFKADFLTLDQIAHSSPLDSADMHKDIGASVSGLNETITLIGVEPLNCASAHEELL